MQRHYDDITDAIHELTCSIRGSSLNREEYDCVWGKLKQIEEQLLPLTLTWVPEDLKPKQEYEKPKTFVNAIAECFERYYKANNL